MDIYYKVQKEISQTSKIDDIPENVDFVWYDIQQLDSESAQLGIVTKDLEDIKTGSYLPKYIDYNDSRLFVCHAMGTDLKAQPINIIVSGNQLITYHNGILDDLIDIEATLKTDGICPVDAALIILERTVENYFTTAYDVEEDVFELEDRQGTNRQRRGFMDDVFEIRSRILKVKRVILPVSELVISIRTEGRLVEGSHQKSVLRHIDLMLKRQMNIIRSIDDMTDEIRDNYVSYNSYKTNRVMTLLTLISAIFLPLTLITGIYGMNFDYMPELSWHYGYFIIMGIMLFISIAMLMYFKIKKWL